MAERDDGGPAFPISEVAYPKDGPPELIITAGMSLRDYFAAQALIGLMATPGALGVNRQSVAEGAYAVADAMIETRK